MWHLVRTDGRVGVVLPRKALEASGMKDWRLAILEHATVTDATVLVNTGGWVFKGIHAQIMVAVVSLLADRTTGDKVLSVRGPFESEKAFLDGTRGESMPIRVHDLLDWSPNGALPLFPDATSLDVFLTLRAAPRLDLEDDSMVVRGLREWNATDDKHRFVFTDEPDGLIPVYKGDSFDLWTPRTGSVYAYADPDRMERDLQERRLNQARTRRSAFYGMPSQWVNDLNTLPMHHPRIAWRDTTNRANARTIITALVPPEVVMVHQAYYLFFRRGTAREQAYVLGVLSSIPFDWFARQIVERHATVEFLLGSPVPRPGGDKGVLRDRVIEISGRLAATEDSYSTWAKEVGVPVGSVASSSERDALVSELDAVVSLLYGLTDDHIEHVFATFNGGWNHENRLEAVLKHYRRWKGNL